MGVLRRSATTVKANRLSAVAKKKKEAKKALKAALTLKRATAATSITRARASRVKGAKRAALAALYVDSSSESEGGKETPRGVTPAFPAAPAAVTLATAVGRASGVTVAAAGISASFVAFWALMANKPPGVAFTLE
ncbi:hypothetical protein ACEPPN_006392 [Leptodophora sp. 'Broadleaf-Isolate-01']